MSPEAFHRKIEYLIEYLGDLKKYRKCTYRTFRKNHYEVERLLELIFTAAIDIIFQTLSEKGEPTPSSYANGFLRAGESYSYCRFAWLSD